MPDSGLIDALVAQATAQTAEEAARHRESFAAAYSTMTDLDPRDAVLVQEQVVRGMTYETRWYYVAKADIRGDEDVRAILAENERLRAQLAAVREVVACRT